MSVSSLTASDRAASLPELIASGWTITPDRDAISKKYKFKDFIDAFSFMTKSAFFAEKMNHHPEWSNIYNTVDVVLSTHDCGGLSNLDVFLARLMDNEYDKVK
eukprot:gene24565-33029_t